MPIAIPVATLSALGLAFYARFLFALYKECRHHQTCDLVRLQTYSPDFPDDEELDAAFRRAA